MQKNEKLKIALNPNVTLFNLDKICICVAE